MIDEFERYAVYWVPARSDRLAAFGASWMGWCAEMGEPQPRNPGAAEVGEIANLTRHVSRHGFHGIIVEPFRLGEGRSRWSIDDRMQEIAEDTVALPMPLLELAVVGGRVALVPSPADAARCRALGAIVARAAAAMEPLTGAGPSRPAPDAHGRRHLAACGSESLRQLPPSAAQRFHVPLTDRLDLPTAFRVKEDLRPWLAPLLAGQRRFADLALMGDPGGGRPLRVLQRFELRETPPRRRSPALPCSGKQTLVQAPAGA